LGKESYSVRQVRQKPKRGRPPLGRKAKKRFNVMLSAPVAEKLRQFGDDNLSGGIEWAAPDFASAKPGDLAGRSKPKRQGGVETGFGRSRSPRDVPLKDPKMNTAVDDRNPTGIVLTQEQKDHSAREGYWMHAIEYGLDYYVAGRFATAHHFTPVSANILHHAVELLLKACLAHDDPLDKIVEYWHPKKGYGHDIVRLWQAFKARQMTPVPPDYDAIIESLHAFEDIRYPETLIRDGATISIGIFEVEGPPILENGRVPENAYSLMLPQIDRLMGLLFDASGANPAAFLPRVTNDKQALIYYDMVRPTLFGRLPPSQNN
jgi:hypothetical protein